MLQLRFYDDIFSMRQLFLPYFYWNNPFLSDRTLFLTWACMSVWYTGYVHVHTLFSNGTVGHGCLKYFFLKRRINCFWYCGDSGLGHFNGEESPAQTDLVTIPFNSFWTVRYYYPSYAAIYKCLLPLHAKGLILLKSRVRIQVGKCATRQRTVRGNHQFQDNALLVQSQIWQWIATMWY